MNLRIVLYYFPYIPLIIETIKSGTMSSSSEIVVVLIGLMVQTCMTKMKGAITPQEIIRRVTSQGNAAGARLSEFKVRTVVLTKYGVVARCGI